MPNEPLPYYFSLITGSSRELLDLTVEPESPLTALKVIQLAKLVARTQWSRVFRQQRTGGSKVIYDSRGGEWGPLCAEVAGPAEGADSADFAFGRFLAQKQSHLIEDLLQSIYDGTVEPRKPLCEFQRGVLVEVSSWSSLGVDAAALLEKIQAEKLH